MGDSTASARAVCLPRSLRLSEPRLSHPRTWVLHPHPLGLCYPSWSRWSAGCNLFPCRPQFPCVHSRSLAACSMGWTLLSILGAGAWAPGHSSSHRLAPQKGLRSGDSGVPGEAGRTGPRVGFPAAFERQGVSLPTNPAPVCWGNLAVQRKEDSVQPRGRTRVPSSGPGTANRQKPRPSPPKASACSGAS